MIDPSVSRSTAANPAGGQADVPVDNAKPNSFDRVPAVQIDLGGRQSFDLLPPDYRAHRDAQRVLRRWMNAVLTLIAIYAASMISMRYRDNSIRRQQATLIRHSLTQREIERRTHDDLRDAERLHRQCDRLQALRPDDRLLKVLQAIAIATGQSSQDPNADRPHLVAIDVTMPFPSDAQTGNAPDADQTSPPPAIALTATVTDRAMLNRWIDCLRRSPSLHRVHAHSTVDEDDISDDKAHQAESADSGPNRVRVTAVPLIPGVSP